MKPEQSKSLSNSLKILFLGDIVGPLGRKAVKTYLDFHKSQDKIDFVIANGENATHGHGLSLAHYNELTLAGIDCLTNGNHYFNTPEIMKKSEMYVNCVRPANFDSSCPGLGSKVFTLKDGTNIRVSNVIGRVFLGLSQSNPFYKMDEIIQEDKKPLIHIVDFHAEATAEKRIMGEYLDGRVSAVIGTHTHVQTNDPRLLPKDTFFLSDAGMNGAIDSVLGDKKEGSMTRTITGMPAELDVSKTGDMQVNGVLLTIDKNTLKVTSYKLINEEIKNG
ncbi:MAG: TIGR00282 family metallophosphoesterase [Bacilli bacterium]